jgi:hypothetical protein
VSYFDRKQTTIAPPSHWGSAQEHEEKAGAGWDIDGSAGETTAWSAVTFIAALSERLRHDREGSPIDTLARQYGLRKAAMNRRTP